MTPSVSSHPFRLQQQRRVVTRPFHKTTATNCNLANKMLGPSLFISRNQSLNYSLGIIILHKLNNYIR